jgi:hypothetical protein
MSFDNNKVSRRVVMGGLAAGAGAIAMPAVLRAQTLDWIGASATPPTDFIAQGLDVFARRVGELSKGQIKVRRTMPHRSAASASTSKACCRARCTSPRPARACSPAGTGQRRSWTRLSGRSTSPPRASTSPRRSRPE